MKNTNFVLVKRGGLVESRHHIHAAIVRPSGELLASVGDPQWSTYFRSSAKPYQTLALFRSGVIDHFGFDDKEIALFTASHNGEPYHVDAVRGVLKKIGLSESALRCGYHPPMLPSAAEAFFALNLTKSPITNNCSGKHAGMLAACVLHGYDLQTYLEPDHPHQRLIRQIVAEFSGKKVHSIKVAVDGCGVPAFYLSLYEMALMNARFAAGKEKGVSRIRQAITAFPEYMAGTDRFDTAFNRVKGPQILTKVGAEAVQSFIIFDPEPLGVVVKCEDGQFRGAEVASIEILRQFGLISQQDTAQLQSYGNPTVTNHAGRIVGEIEPQIELKRVSGD